MEGSGTENYNTSERDCFNFTGIFPVIAVLSGSISLFSLLANLLVIFLIIGYKKYVLFPQKVILYVNIAAGIYSGAIVFGAGVGYLPTTISSSFYPYCVLAGFFYQTAAWMFLGAIWIAVVDIYLVVKGTETRKYERVYVAVIFGLPILTCWLPFIDSSYGKAGPWCWIRSINNDANCSTHTYGLILQFAIWHIPLGASTIAIMIIYILILRDIRRRSFLGKNKPHEDRLHKVLEKEMKYFLIFPIIFFVITILSASEAISGLIGKNQMSLAPLWVINAVLVPLQGAIIAFLIGFDRETLIRLLHNKPCLCCKKSKVSEYPATLHQRLSLSYSTAMDNAMKNHELRSNVTIN